MSGARLALQPMGYKEACSFIATHHRHHGVPQGFKYAIGCNNGERIVGVVIVGRPVARLLDDGFTAEITRCCTDSTPHVASKLYAAAWRAARAMGYRRMITYTMKDETGVSLVAAGWKIVYQTRGDTWNRPGTGRIRVDAQPTGQKSLWEMTDER